MQSRRAVPFFPSSTRRAKKTRGASETTRQWYASNEFKSLPKESTCSENVEFPLSRFCPQKVLDRKGTARKGVLPRKTRAQSRVTKGRREKVIWGAGEGVKPPRKSVSPSRKRIQGKTKQSSNSFLFLSLGCCLLWNACYQGCLWEPASGSFPFVQPPDTLQARALGFSSMG